MVAHDLDGHRHEDVVDPIDVDFGRRGAVARSPGLADPRQVHHGFDVVALRHAHRPARFVAPDLDAELRERTDEDAHRREAAVVDHGAGPVEHDRLQLRLGHQIPPNRSAITSSPIANAVLAPVPLVTITRRTAGSGASMTKSQSGRDA